MVNGGRVVEYGTIEIYGVECELAWSDNAKDSMLTSVREQLT